jgi:hypothetical protein
MEFTRLYAVEFHHGDCVGADAEADDLIAQIGGCKIVIHPPDNPRKRAFKTRYPGRIVLPAKPYLMRNHDIVDATDILIAAPKTNEEELRSGTWATIRYAMKQGKEVLKLHR